MVEGLVKGVVEVLAWEVYWAAVVEGLEEDLVGAMLVEDLGRVMVLEAV